MFLKKYYCIKQHDLTDCAAACLAIIAKEYGLKIPIAQIRKKAGTDKQGTNALGLIKAAKELGFSAKGVKGEAKDLSKDIPLPAIAHVFKDNLMHYIVIHEIRKNEIIIADPAEGLVKYKLEEFIAMWSGVLIFIIPSQDFKKRDETSSLFSRFFNLIRPHKKLLLEIFLASVLYTLMGIIAAFYFKYLIDTIITDGLVKTLHIISTGMIILMIFKVLMNAFRSHLILYLSQKIDISLILNYYQHVIELPMSFFDTRRVGEIISRLGDASKIRDTVSGATISVMIDSLMVIAGAVVLYLQSSTLFGIASVVIPFYFLLVWSFNKSFRKIHKKEMEEAADLQAYLVESLTGIATVKAFSGEEEAKLLTENRFIKFLKAIFKATYLRNVQESLQVILTSISEIIIFWIGGLYVIRGEISIGQLISFNALLAYYYNPLQNLITLQAQLQESFVAATRLGEILDLEKEKKGEENKVKRNHFRGSIEFKKVVFRYGTRKKVLKDINLKIEPGEKVALVGESGSGKSTLVKLLLNYYQVETGEILIDEYNIQDISLQDLRTRIAYVPQEIFLFSGSIKDNIAFAVNNVSMEEIVKAACQAQVHEFINDLPLRYETKIGERGADLSGGQRQRLAIARAFLKKPDILILDEASSNLDTTTEKAIHKTITKISQGLTTIIIAHRLSTIRECDTIVVLNNGVIRERGSHQKLLKIKGHYYQLWQKQTLDTET